MDVLKVFIGVLLIVSLVFGVVETAQTDIVHFSHGVAVTTKSVNIEDIAPDSQIKIRKRGRRGGVRVRSRKRTARKPFLPVIILGNARSIVNKIDELQACTETFL